MVKAIPEGCHAVTPYLIVDGAAAAIEFYVKVFRATEKVRMAAPGGKIGHAELLIGDSHLMLADQHPEIGAVGPKTVGGTPVAIMVYLEDVDAAVERALEGGATVEKAVADQFYGDRMGTIVDPFGHRWYIATHVEDVSPEEMKRRAAALGG